MLRQVRIGYPNGQTTTYDYYPNATATTGTGNGDQRLKQIVNKKGATNYSQFDYGYEVDGAISTWTKALGTNNPVDAAFTYDPIDRLTGATYKDGAAVLAQYGYSYDKADNRTTERIDDSVTTGTHNNLNQLTALNGGGLVNFSGTTSEEAEVVVNGQSARSSQLGTRFEKALPLAAGTNTVTITAEDPSGNTASQDYEVVVNGGSSQSFTYDANGNLLDDGTRQYAWDAENRLIKVTDGTKTTNIEYDGLHHWTRILEKDGGTTLSDRRFIWVENELVEQRNDTSTTAAQRYFPQGVQQGSNKYFYTKDHLGSIREVVNNSGAVVARYDYDPYGRRSKLSGSFDSDFGFTGHYYHEPSGLHFAPFRAYSAELGRWISRDPIEEEGGINLYAYVKNKVVVLYDSLGLISADSIPFVRIPLGLRTPPGASEDDYCDLKRDSSLPTVISDADLERRIAQREAEYLAQLVAKSLVGTAVDIVVAISTVRANKIVAGVFAMEAVVASGQTIVNAGAISKAANSYRKQNGLPIIGP